MPGKTESKASDGQSALKVDSFSRRKIQRMRLRILVDRWQFATALWLAGSRGRGRGPRCWLQPNERRASKFRRSGPAGKKVASVGGNGPRLVFMRGSSVYQAYQAAASDWRPTRSGARLVLGLVAGKQRGTGRSGRGWLGWTVHDPCLLIFFLRKPGEKLVARVKRS